MKGFDPAYDTGFPLTFTTHHKGRWTFSVKRGVGRVHGWLEKRQTWTDEMGFHHIVRWQIRYVPIVHGN